MAKKNGIPQNIVVEALNEVLPTDESFSVIAQRSFIKIFGPGKQRVYVASSKEVRQIDLAFTLPENHGWESVIPVRRANGRVQAELDTEHPRCLEDLKSIIGWMKTAPAEPAEERTEKFVPQLPTIAQRRPAADTTPPVDLAGGEGRSEQRVEADDVRD